MKDQRLLEKDFEEYIEQYQAMITKVARVYSFDQDTQDDLIQEIVLQLWKAFPKYNKEKSTSTWTYRIALNVSISFLRKESSRKKNHGDYQQHAELYQQESPELEEQIKILYQFIELLKPTDKALMLLFLEGCKNKEIAKIMGISASLVSTKIHRIKEQLKSYFETLKQ
ncbi:RNA polymerase sigma factor [Echinicola sp. 20G]|uniref:RNA polymerase sigma factor n=1 Tax=Echinicola sp. 20G TaxID=2781961 RepID=UPI001F1EE09A|nr:sigma-70 family RNA polymerase sigma factor [Echinicola sp. 20G]